MEHHPVEPRAADLVTELEEVLRFQEEPFASLSIYAQWCVMKAARERGVTVLLDGQGADELFGGYPGANGWALRGGGLRTVARALVSERDAADVLRAIGADWAPRAIVRRHRRRSTSSYAPKWVREAAAAVSPSAIATRGFETPLSRELLRQSFQTSLPPLLRYADRNSMAHSREVRLPYLDRRIAEFAFSLPAEFLYREGQTKAILRAAVRGLAPDEILTRRDKVGYEPPQANWLAEQPLVDKISEVLLDGVARSRNLYDTEAIEADARVKRWRDPQGIWRALNLELWLQTLERSRALA
jgi:asparagine synthase (glutamine-hydrolysing)